MPFLILLDSSSRRSRVGMRIRSEGGLTTKKLGLKLSQDNRPGRNQDCPNPGPKAWGKGGKNREPEADASWLEPSCIC